MRLTPEDRAAAKRLEQFNKNTKGLEPGKYPFSDGSTYVNELAKVREEQGSLGYHPLLPGTALGATKEHELYTHIGREVSLVSKLITRTKDKSLAKKLSEYNDSLRDLALALEPWNTSPNSTELFLYSRKERIAENFANCGVRFWSLAIHSNNLKMQNFVETALKQMRRVSDSTYVDELESLLEDSENLLLGPVNPLKKLMHFMKRSLVLRKAKEVLEKIALDFFDKLHKDPSLVIEMRMPFFDMNEILRD